MHEMGLGLVVSMRDMLSRNAHRIQSAMMSLDATVAGSASSMQRNLQVVQRATMLIGAGLALLAVPTIVIASTVATQKALGEMASLGVKDLQSLSRAAEEFSNTWGGTSKAEFTAAAYDIKSGIASLTDAAVGEYTKLAALTAKATKSTVAEMTSLFATGYGISRSMYAKMTDFEFGRMYSGGIAASVQAFKTTGSGMASAISQLGAIATTANVPLKEQLSILGMLQATMSGAEAGTKYRAFMKSAAEAGKELDLGFVDQNNNLLGMVAILKKLRDRYGDTLDAMEKMEIQKAFGRAEAVAVVDLFYDKIGDLTGNIRQMSAAMRQGTRLTLEMAQAMNLDIGSQVALVGQQFHNLFETLGEVLLPITLIIVGIVAAVYLLRRAWRTNFAGIRDVVMGFYTKVKLVFQGVYQLLSSLSNGTGQISAELADKLKALGLWEFVKTVFMVYYRVREYLAGLWPAYAAAFKKIVRIVEPAVRALLSAYGALYSALFSVLEALGLASTAAEGSAYRSLGATLGTIAGIVGQIGAHILKFFIYPMAWVICIVALAVRAVVWLVQTVVQGTTSVAAFVYKFSLPFRLLINSVVAVVKTVHTLWQVLRGDTSVLDGLKRIGASVFDYLATPFRWVGDVAVGFWGLVQRVFSRIPGFLRWAGGLIASAILDLPIVRTLAGIWRGVRAFFAGDRTFFQAGKGMLLAMGRGLLSVITWPHRLVERAFGWIARLLPFSDAQEGPLSRLSEAGRAIITTLCNGILAAARLPIQIVGAAFRGILRLGGAVWSGLEDIGSAAWSAVTAPFGWVRDAASTAWSGIKDAAASAWQGMASMAGSAWEALSAPFSRLRETASSAWEWIRGKAAGAWEGIRSAASAGWEAVKTVTASAHEAGRSVLTTVAKGAESVITAPYKAAKKALGFVRSLLPFSDAREGPLADLSAAGRAVLETMVGGMQRVADLPAKAFSRIWGFLGGRTPATATAGGERATGWLGGLTGALSGVVAGLTSALMPAPALAGPAAALAASADKPLPAVVREREVEQRRMLAERVTTVTPAPAGAPALGAGPLSLDALLAKLDELGDRPVEVNITVVSKLDGRAVAQAVYRNIRQEKVKNYETL